MAFTDDVAALKAEVTSTVAGYTQTATTTLAALQADDAALADLQDTIAGQRTTIAAQISAYKGIVPTAIPAAPAPTA
jgi:hypothetical protein